MASWFCFKELADEQKKALEQARVPLVSVRIHQPETIAVLAFPDDERDRAMETLGWKDRYFNEVSTDDSNLFLLTPVEPGVKLIDDGQMYGHWPQIREALQPFAEKLGIEITVINNRGRSRAPSTQPGRMEICFHSASSVQGSTQLEKIFGRSLDDETSYAVRNLKADWPLEDDGKVVFGEIAENTLYIHFNLPASRFAKSLLTTIMERYVSETSTESQDGRASRRRELAKKSFVVFGMNSLTGIISTVQREIEAKKSNAMEWQNRLLALERDIVQRTWYLDALKNKPEEFKSRLAEEYDRIMALQGVKDLKVQDGAICVWTEEIEIADHGYLYDIGPFRIEFRPSADGRSSVLCFNLQNRSRDTRDFHPHITSDGHPCLGNISEELYSRIASNEWDVATDLMLRYLKSVNPGNTYSRVDCWPKKPMPRGGSDATQ